MLHAHILARLAASLLAVAMAALPARAEATYSPTAHDVTAKSIELSWHYDAVDPAAEPNREVPLKIDYPSDIATRTTPCPIIIFSHGLGGSREGYAMWGDAWAAAGYVVIHPTHVGSDTSIIKGGMASLKGGINLKNALLRIQDVHFVIDQIEKSQSGTLAESDLAFLKGKLDTAHIGMAGHSFGAETTDAIAGETYPGKEPTRADKRVTAAIAMSAQPGYGIDEKNAFASIHIPMLYFTGTKDNTELGAQGRPNSPGNVTPEDRKVPFQNAVDPRTYLVVFEGATHMSFGQPERDSNAPTRTGRFAAANANSNTPTDGDTKGNSLRALLAARMNGNTGPHIAHFVNDASIAFWDAYLKNNPAAKSWLETDFSKELGTAGTYQKK